MYSTVQYISTKVDVFHHQYEAGPSLNFLLVQGESRFHFVKALQLENLKIKRQRPKPGGAWPLYFQSKFTPNGTAVGLYIVQY